MGAAWFSDCVLPSIIGGDVGQNANGGVAAAATGPWYGLTYFTDFFFAVVLAGVWVGADEDGTGVGDSHANMNVSKETNTNSIWETYSYVVVVVRDCLCSAGQPPAPLLSTVVLPSPCHPVPPEPHRHPQ